MLKKISLNTIVYGIGPQLPKFASLLILPLITPYLTPFDFGVFGLAQAYVLFFQNLKSLGLDVILANSFIKKPKQFKVIWRVVYGAIILSSAIVTIILAALLFFSFHEKLEDNFYKFLFLVCSPLFLFSPTEVIFSRYYQLKEKSIIFSSRTIIAGLVNVFVSYYTIVHLQMGYMGWVWGVFSAGVAGFLLSYPLVTKEGIFPIFRLRSIILKRSLKVSLPLVPHYYGNYVLSSGDRLILDFVGVKASNIGLYNAGYSIGNYFNIVATAIKRATAPTILKLLKDDSISSRKKVARILINFAIILLSATTLSSIWSDEIIKLLIRNESLQNVYYVSIWVFMAYNYVPIHIGANLLLTFHERTQKLWIRALIVMVFNVIMNLIFIPIYGIIAAAVISYLSYYLLAITSYFLKDFKELNIKLLTPFPWILLSIAATFLSLYLVDQLINFKLLISSILIAITLIVFYYYNQDQLLLRLRKYKLK